MKEKIAKKPKIEPLPVSHVRFIEAKPNKMFTEHQTTITKFLEYTRAVPCAHCKKRSKYHWTQTLFFRVMDLGSFALTPGKKILPPLTPVCRDHILEPQIEENQS